MSISDRLYAESVLKLLLRAEIVSEDDVLAIADEHDILADRNQHMAEHHKTAAHQLRVTLFAVDPPPAVDPAVEFRADFLRRQMIERTAMIAKDGRE